MERKDTRKKRNIREISKLGGLVRGDGGVEPHQSLLCFVIFSVSLRCVRKFAFVNMGSSSFIRRAQLTILRMGPEIKTNKYVTESLFNFINKHFARCAAQGQMVT